MIEEAGLGIAFRAKPALVEVADAELKHHGLDALAVGAGRSPPRLVQGLIISPGPGSRRLPSALQAACGRGAAFERPDLQPGDRAGGDVEGLPAGKRRFARQLAGTAPRPLPRCENAPSWIRQLPLADGIGGLATAGFAGGAGVQPAFRRGLGRRFWRGLGGGFGGAFALPVSTGLAGDCWSPAQPWPAARAIASALLAVGCAGSSLVELVERLLRRRESLRGGAADIGIAEHRSCVHAVAVEQARCRRPAARAARPAPPPASAICSPLGLVAVLEQQQAERGLRHRHGPGRPRARTRSCAAARLIGTPRPEAIGLAEVELRVGVAASRQAGARSPPRPA